MSGGAIDLTLWKVLTFLFVGVALLWETRPAYGLAYLGLLLFFIFQYCQGKATERLMVERLVGECYLFPDDTRSLTLQVTNPTLWNFAWISIADRIPAQLMTGRRPKRSVFALSSRSSQEVTFQITARERGVYCLGPLDVFVGDFFGIRTQRFGVVQEQTVVVFPPIYQIADLALPARLSFGSFKALWRMHPDSTRLAGLRHYQEGDRLRSIHWPATARTQTLQVKQFDHTVTATCVVFLDLYKGNYAVSKFHVGTELAITTGASLANYLIQRGEACGLVSNAILAEYSSENVVASHEGALQILPRQGIAQLTQILTVLAGVKTQEKKDFLHLLTEYAHLSEGAAIWLWVVPKDTPELIERAWNFVKKGRQVLIFVVDEVCHQEFLHSSPDSPLQVFHISTEGGIVS